MRRIPNAIDEVIPLELTKDKSDTTPASEDPGCEPSSASRRLAVDLINNGINVLDQLFVLCFNR
jgi:hypothetical protein